MSVPEDTDVLFLLSVPTALKSRLLAAAALLCYTPEREHFGIVPLEAMLAGVPVLAHNSGGPLETVEEGVTGWLRGGEPREWCEVMRRVLFEAGEEELREMGRRGREKVVREFSKGRLAERLEREWEGVEVSGGAWGWVLGVLGVLGVVIGVSVAVAVGW